MEGVMMHVLGSDKYSFKSRSRMWENNDRLMFWHFILVPEIRTLCCRAVFETNRGRTGTRTVAHRMATQVTGIFCPLAYI
jgi:hypothetical protein